VISLLMLIASVNREIRRELRERFQHARQRSPHRANYQFVTLTLNLDLQSDAIVSEFIGDTDSL
jgi:hypothetical protein